MRTKGGLIEAFISPEIRVDSDCARASRHCKLFAKFAARKHQRPVAQTRVPCVLVCVLHHFAKSLNLKTLKRAGSNLGARFFVLSIIKIPHQ